MMLPRILVIDDFYGRTVPGGNNDRRALCINFSLNDISPDAHPEKPAITPVADAVFIRGQLPACAGTGDAVENDVEGVFNTILNGWDDSRLAPGELPWSMILLDMCFYTGLVTAESEKVSGEGMPQGCPEDDMPGHYFGLKILEFLKAKMTVVSDLKELPVVVLSSMSREELEPQTEELLVRAFLPRTDLNSPVRFKNLLEQYKLVPDTANGIIGISKSLLLTLRKARRAAQGNQDILLLGETGSGKNLIAGAIHAQSRRSKGPFKELNCAAISPSLIESELFGHVKGAFTGAVGDKKGYFVAADGGTLLIDEVGDMPLDVQVKLLSALESRTVTPVGSTDVIKFDTRIITATNANLEQLVAEKKFRSDLYYRIRPCLISVPPLRARGNDFPLLISHIIKKANGNQRQLHSGALQLIKNYSWPGNFRELRFCIEQILNEYPEAKNIHPGHLYLPEKNSSSENESPDTKLLFSSQAKYGFLKIIASVLADQLIASMEKTKQNAVKKNDGRSIARTIAFLEGSDCAESGPEPARKLKKILKFILSYAPECADKLNADPLLAFFISKEDLLP